jgi:hypothetical protein
MSNFERCWKGWLESHGLPTGRSGDDIALDSVWRHTELPGEFSFDWRFGVGPKVPPEPRILFWRPPGQTELEKLTRKKLFAIASSRMGRRFDGLENWIAALRTAICEIYRQGQGIVTAEGTSTHLFVERMAELLHLPTVVLRAMPERPTQSWFEQFSTKNSTPQQFSLSRNAVDVYWTPVGPRPFAAENESLIDFAILSGADAVRLLAVRGKQNTYRSVSTRLKQNFVAGDVWLLRDESMTSKSIREELIELGAVDWVLRGSLSDDLDGERRNSPGVDVLRASEIPGIENYLVHSTRTPSLNPRKLLSNQEIDRLLFKQTLDDAGPLSGLLRILADGWLRGGTELLPGSLPMVSWTEHPLPRLRELRVYRKHLARWDFEPFGISVKRERLAELGARRVTYFDHESFQVIAPEEKAFGQRAGSQIGDEWVDWTCEREWRFLGDLNLSLLSPSDALIFVGDMASAQIVAPYSRWPVVLVD